MKAEVYQFFSRASFPYGSHGKVKTHSARHPDIIFELELHYAKKPFDMGFAQLLPTRPSIGAFQYVDADVDTYFSQRWPACVMATGTVHVPGASLPDDVRRHLLSFLRWLLWHKVDGVLAIPVDQKASVLGYRREFFHSQFFDITGTRRPSGEGSFTPTEIGEPIGPGVAIVPELDASSGTNEFVWSPILPFPVRRNFADDKTAILRKLESLKKYYNSHAELADASRHVENGEPKAAIRSAASAVDASLRHMRETWSTPEPPKHLPFNEKIEFVLHAAGKPSYRAVEPDNWKQLLYLYRARNTMHEGDCYYQDEHERTIQIRRASEAAPFVDVVKSFVLWADSIV